MARPTGQDACLSVLAEPVTEEGGRPKRSRRVAFAAPSPEQPQEQSEAATGRPTSAERAAAEAVVVSMREVVVEPPILTKNAPADPSVVACALALHFGEIFSSDRVAKEQFGIAGSTDIRGRWIKGKLAKLLECNPAAVSAIAHTSLMARGIPLSPPRPLLPLSPRWRNLRLSRLP